MAKHKTICTICATIRGNDATCCGKKCSNISEKKLAEFAQNTKGKKTLSKRLKILQDLGNF
jgi:predicted nucleic acid-binding Zn ribbon protein